MKGGLKLQNLFWIWWPIRKDVSYRGVI